MSRCTLTHPFCEASAAKKQLRCVRVQSTEQKATAEKEMGQLTSEPKRCDPSDPKGAILKATGHFQGFRIPLPTFGFRFSARRFAKICKKTRPSALAVAMRIRSAICYLARWFAWCDFLALLSL